MRKCVFLPSGELIAGRQWAREAVGVYCSGPGCTGKEALLSVLGFSINSCL